MSKMKVRQQGFSSFGRVVTHFCLSTGVSFLLAAAAWGQSGLPVSYETRISLPETADVLGVNEIIFSWTTNATGGIISIDEVNDLIMKVDDTSPNVGIVYQDRIVEDGVIQPLLGPDNGGSPPALLRTAANVAWRFNLNTMQVESFGNLLGVDQDDFDGLGFEGSVYQVEGSGGLPGYEIVTYPIEGVEQTWEGARDKAYAMGGALASITTPTEEKLIFFKLRTHPEPIRLGLWLGGYQKSGSAEPAGGWRWLDGGFIPTVRNYTSYSNWKRGQPDNSGGAENYLAAYVGGAFGWSDQANDAAMDGFVVEFPGGEVSITRFIDGEIDYGDSIPDTSTESQLRQRTGIVSSTTARNFFAPPGQGTIFDIDLFEQEGNVIQSGNINADVCIAPDPREPIFIIEEDDEETEETEGEGFSGGPLPVALLAGTGTCTGDLPLVSETDEYQTWEELLADVELVVPEYYRAFFGEVTFVPLGGQGYEEVTIRAAWISVAVIRSDGVEYDGPVSSVQFPESFVDYSNTPVGEIPACSNELDYRSLDVGGTNVAFGEWPNIEGIDVILHTAQCNRSWSLTGRTTHLSPMRFVGSGSAAQSGTQFLIFQLKGLSGTLAEAASCLDPTLQSALAGAYAATLSALASQDYYLAIAQLEEFASIADAGDDYDDGFNACAIERNYRGSLVSRAIIAAFTTWDRLLPENQDPETWQIYPLPEEFCSLVPDLRDDTGDGPTCVISEEL